MQALHESDWFTPVEREGLQNILTERKIIRAAQATNPNQGELPPLTTAKIILEGGIISYDTNVKTGGSLPCFVSYAFPSRTYTLFQFCPVLSLLLLAEERFVFDKG